MKTTPIKLSFDKFALFWNKANTNLKNTNPMIPMVATGSCNYLIKKERILLRDWSLGIQV